MSKKVTMKFIKETHVNVLSFRCCQLYGLLYFRKPDYHTSGVYGWNADVYSYGTTAIVTGNRPFGKEVPATICEQFENEAWSIISNWDILYEERQEKVEALLEKFINKVIE